jgi:hypothetical protein
VNVNSGFAYDAKSRVVCWRLEGEVTEEVFAVSLQQLPAVVAGSNPRSGIIDLSKVTAFRVSAEALKRLATTEPVFPAEFPRVIVAGGDHVYGMARMFAALTEPLRSNVQVVRTLKEAYKALGVKSPEFRDLELKKKVT